MCPHWFRGDLTGTVMLVCRPLPPSRLSSDQGARKKACAFVFTRTSPLYFSGKTEAYGVIRWTIDSWVEQACKIVDPGFRRYWDASFRPTLSGFIITISLSTPPRLDGH